MLLVVGAGFWKVKEDVVLDRKPFLLLTQKMMSVAPTAREPGGLALRLRAFCTDCLVSLPPMNR